MEMIDVRYRICDGDPESLAGDGTIELPANETIRFAMPPGHSWYGHGFAHRQPYPLNREAVVSQRFAVNNIQAPIWMCSAGFAILAQTDEALQVALNADGDGWLSIACPTSSITLAIFQAETLSASWRKLMASLDWPPIEPTSKWFGDSVFCTWTQYPRCITQERILSTAQEIRQHNFPCSVITIDDRWESGFGELTFSAEFPHPREMVDRLHGDGFEVLLWVTPFINTETANFEKLASDGLLVGRKDGSGPALLTWWGGTAGLIDLTNPAGAAWYRSQLLRLKNEIGVDGFKIDGGDAKYQPDPAIARWHRPVGASEYSNLLLGLFEQIAPGTCESRTAWMSQSRRILWREGGKDSHWGVDNGLKAMVTLGLHLGLMGYDTMIPDMVPGRIQTMVSDMALPTDELFVRWTEASAFMPILQFSYFPWNYAPDTAEIVRQCALMHKAMEGYLSEQATGRTAPLLRPLWFDEPSRDELYSIDDEYLIGDDLLVAPVLTEAQIARDIVLPSGTWRDVWTGQTYKQPTLTLYPAPCPGIPLFVRETNPSLYEALHAIAKSIPRGTIRPGATTSAYQCGLDRDIKVTG